MRICLFAFLLIATLGQDAFAQKSKIKSEPIDPIRLTCLLRDGKFYTEILFTKTAEDLIEGEMDNYVSTPDHGRRFLSGNIFFDVIPGNDFITGHTGDKRGIIMNFELRQMTSSPNGFWSYEQTDQNGAKLRARFRCQLRE